MRNRLRNYLLEKVNNELTTHNDIQLFEADKV